MLTEYLPATTIFAIKFVAVALVVVAWALIVWKQWWASAFVLVAPGALVFLVLVCAFLGSILTGGRVDVSKVVNQMIAQIVKEAAVVVTAILMTVTVGVGLFVL